MRTSAKALIVRDEKVLLIRINDRGHTRYILPGGGQKRGEALSSALERECKEELGATVRVGELLCVREYIGKNHNPRHDADFHQVEFVFLCILSTELSIENATIHDIGQTGTEWVAVESLNDMDVSPACLGELIHDMKRPSVLRYLGDIP